MTAAASASHPRSPDAPWRAARRGENRAGEIRINLIRLLAIAVFYGYHLVNYYIRQVPMTTEYHAIVTGIALAWLAASILTHVALARSAPVGAWLKYAVVAWDALMATSLCLYSGGPRSPFLLLLFLILASAPLRMDIQLVWFTAVAVAVSYGAICANSKWVRPETRVPVEHHVIFALGLGAGALFAGQSVRQSMRLAGDLAQRMTALGDRGKGAPAAISNLEQRERDS